MLPVEAPFKTYTGLDGKPLNNGYVYFGLPDQNPITAPVTVYWDKEGTIPAAQPLRTVNGYIMRAGTPANVFFDGGYSEVVQDSKGRQVFYARNSNTFSIAAQIAAILSNLSATTVNFLQKGVGAVLRTLQDRGEDSICVFDFMSPAQIADVRALTRSVDVTVAIQAALDYAAPRSRAVYFPGGTYLISSSLLLVNSARLIGETQRACTIWGATGMTTPLINSKTGIDLTYTTISDMGFYNGAHCIGITVSAETAFMKFIRCDFYAIAGYNCVYVNKLLQTSLFDSCTFSGGNLGVCCAAFTANANTFINCKFGNHAYASVYFRNSSVNNFFGCNFEGGGIAGRTVIDVTVSEALNFYGCYFENGHTYLLNDQSSQNGVSFEKCHFTYAVGNVQYKILCDGKYVRMDGNDYYLPMDGAPEMFISGPTDGLLGTVATRINTIDALSVHKVASGSSLYPVSGVKDLVKFKANPQDNALTTMAMLTGVLTFNFQSINTGGTGNIRVSRRYHVSVASVAGGTMAATATVISSAESLGAATIVVATKPGATPFELILQATFTGVSTPAGSILSCAFESDCAADVVPSYIVPSMA
jgi:hypothetical protein